MQSYALNQDQVIKMLANKIDLPEETTKILLQVQVAPITTETGYRDSCGANLGWPPLLEKLEPIREIEPESLMLPDYGSRLLAALRIPVTILGVEVLTTVYFCELRYIRRDTGLIIDNFRFHKQHDNATWRLYVS